MNWLLKCVKQANTMRVFKGWVPYDYETNQPITRVERPSDFPTFYPEEPDLKGVAGFFTTDLNVAQYFADRISTTGVVGTFDITIQNPYEIDAQGQKAGIIQFGKTGAEFQNAVRSGQYDAIIIRNTSDEGDVIVGLNPDNITIIDPGTK